MKKQYKYWLTMIILGILFGVLVWLVASDLAEPIDTLVYNFINQFKTPLLTSFIKIYTKLGGPLILIIIALGLGFWLRKKKGYLIPINLGLVAGFNYLLKMLIARERPIDINLITERGFSFPSGHAMTSIAFYGYIAYLLSKRYKDKKVLIYGISGLLIMLIGISRIYLGVHFATDILAGWTMGLIYLISFIKISDR